MLVPSENKDMHDPNHVAGLAGHLRRPLFIATLVSVLFWAGASTISAQGPKRNASYRQAPTAPEWVFDIRDGENDIPAGKVWLRLGARKVLVLPDASEHYSIVERKDYKRSHIPSSALTAIFGWFAGQGKQLWVVPQRRHLVVYIKYFDEGTRDIPAKRLKRIKW
jgi:hypothetical protein